MSVGGSVGLPRVRGRRLRVNWLRSVWRRPLTRVVVYRLLISVMVLFVVSALTFVLVAMVPGNAAQEILGRQASPAQIRSLEHQLGLDLPLHERYWRWLSHAVQGDFGRSIVSQAPVFPTLVQRLPVTISLTILITLFALVLGVGVGMLSATRGGTTSKLVDGLNMIAFAVPSFVVGVFLISLIAVQLKWLPAIGYTPFTESPKGWIISLTLPIIAVALHGFAGLVKQTREAMLDAMASEYVRMAWARGISPRSIFFRHAFRNASLKIITLLGLMFVGLLGGVAFVEWIFGLPGMGALAIDAANKRDVPLIQALTCFFAVKIILANLLIDLAYTKLDPRVKLA